MLRLNILGYENIWNPRRFFTKGRIFMVHWHEPHGQHQGAFSKVRMFVVIRTRSGYSLCHPIHTYSKQGTSKRGVNPDIHAVLLKEGSNTVYHPSERQHPPGMPQLSAVIEDPDFQLSPYSRINFGKLSTVEHNIRARKIGRISPHCLLSLETSFRRSLGVNNGGPELLEEEEVT